MQRLLVLALIGALSGCASSNKDTSPLVGQWDGSNTCFSVNPGWRETISLRLRNGARGVHGEVFMYRMNPRTGDERYAVTAVEVIDFRNNELTLKGVRQINTLTGSKLETTERKAQLLPGPVISLEACGTPAMLHQVKPDQ